MTRIDFWDKISRIAARIDKALEPKPPYQHKADKLARTLMVADSRIRIAIYVAWLALRGDTGFYKRWETRHIHGVEHFVQDEKNEKQRRNLLAAAELSGDRQLKEELGSLILKNRAQAHEIRKMQKAAERRNLDLAALHIVWCDGGCPGGVGTPETLDRAVVLRAVLSVRRLVSWWNNSQYAKSGHVKTEDYLRERVSFKSPEVEGD